MIDSFFNKNVEDLLAKGDLSTLEVDVSVFEKLFDHQIIGINFLYENFKGSDGCILADDMGLGKTVQVSTFLTSLRFAKVINKAIIVVPATLIDYWYNEIHNWLPPDKPIQIERLYGSVPQRHKLIANIKRYKCLVIAGFDTFKRDYELLQTTCKWDVMIVDEGHKAKNVATGLRKALKEFKVER